MPYRRWVRSFATAMVFCCAAMLRAEDQPPSPPQPAAPQAKGFDKTYCLEFKLIATGYEECYIAYTSQGDFAIRYAARKEGDEYGVDIAGTLLAVEGDDRLRTSFKFAFDRSDQAGDGFDMANTGSVIVDLGKPRTIARNGGYELRFTVRVDDGRPADEEGEPQHTKDGEPSP